jgi:hypothetical protein
MDIYTEVAEATAIAIAVFIPRRGKSVPIGGGNDY